MLRMKTDSFCLSSPQVQQMSVVRRERMVYNGAAVARNKNIGISSSCPGAELAVAAAATAKPMSPPAAVAIATAGHMQAGYQGSACCLRRMQGVVQRKQLWKVRLQRVRYLQRLR
eukprot:5878504-Pleurochrysis_carterae.AAC.1